MASLPPFNHEQFPFGDEVSRALTDLRTVLSRAENALGQHNNWPGSRPGDPDEVLEAYRRDHPLDGERMVRDLQTVVATLDRYRRTRPAPKGDGSELEDDDA